MGRILDALRGPFLKREKEGEANAEELRHAFKTRYHHFKLLLNANNKALEIMAEMETALLGTSPFGMNFVRSRCTAMSTNVWQITRNLNELAPKKYEELYGSFKEIQLKINPFISHRDVAQEGPFVLPLRSVVKEMADQVGSKVANLGEIKNRLHRQVQNGFAVTAKGYYRFMEHNDFQAEIDRRIQATNVERLDQLHALSAGIQQLMIGSPLPADLEEAIKDQYRRLADEEGRSIRVAMRSSALGEDFAGTSFAGQYRSELNVSGEHILDVYKEIVASKYSLPAMAYRLNRGIRDEDVAMCVGCMAMMDAVSGGVLYSRNPLNFNDETLVINSVWGLPKAVVDGSAASDLFIVSRGEPMAIIRREVALKEQKLACYPEAGVRRLDVPEPERHLASVEDDQVMELARLAVELEGHYGAPQDIEWAIQMDGSIVLLQCRPLTQVEEFEGPDLDTVYEKRRESVILKGGVSASPGTAAGPVYLVCKDMDALQFPEGGVLVTTQALPRWASFLNRAAAVITEKGGVTGHLASVAREFGVPALFGVEGATGRLKNGQMVTVDVNIRSVYEGRIESLLSKQKSTKRLMEGSPVYEALKGVTQHIIPLNLLDPDAPNFSSRNCKTMHDITRFCHEKAVHEMFQFGKDHRFPEHSSKQLFCDVPMQWWVLNLDDGFREEVGDKYVRLENIVSIPMLALWEGITSVPWEGPPPVDGKGFMSVMFQATTNRALVPTVRSKFANRNYFMISKNYCSLNSRLGFHFSTVEALVSERSSENYISFQFKGGAADFERRLKRVLFVRDILEEHGFRVGVKEDTIIARLEDQDEAFMKKRLKIIGYLTIHTRQLDMIMSNEASVSYYRSKIRNDIQEL
ncbi:MAG: pyruvate, water dikinase [Desulfobacterales bacterium]|nr:pyruvate, water dikinase [Desulfobacterales bacterium]MBL7102440.1 pyruvate, water dikinase [Desulfobacteraceae bacterium]MBL7173345.1 pyruvate, water dikinase [Desulfobacteraceae bacterium]